MFDCSWYNSFKDRTVHLKTRIGIALDQIGLEFATDVEIQAIELKIMAFPLRIHILKTGPHHISSNLPHSVQYLLLKTIVFVREVRIQISLKLAVG